VYVCIFGYISQHDKSRHKFKCYFLFRHLICEDYGVQRYQLNKIFVTLFYAELINLNLCVRALVTFILVHCRYASWSWCVWLYYPHWQVLSSWCSSSWRCGQDASWIISRHSSGMHKAV